MKESIYCKGLDFIRARWSNNFFYFSLSSGFYFNIICLFRFFTLCKNTMEPVVFIQVMIVLLVTCCQMGIFFLNPFNQNMISFCSTVVQILLYCVCGELVATKAFEVSQRTYASRWYDINDQKLKKSLIMVINQGQQPCFFSIGNYSPLSMETFAMVSRHLKTK